MTIVAVMFGLLGGLALAVPLIIVGLVKRENLRHRLFRRRVRPARPASPH